MPLATGSTDRVQTTLDGLSAGCLDHWHLPTTTGWCRFGSGRKQKDDRKGNGRSTNPNTISDVFHGGIDHFQSIRQTPITSIQTATFRPTFATHVFDAIEFPTTDSQLIQNTTSHIFPNLCLCLSLCLSVCVYLMYIGRLIAGWQNRVQRNRVSSSGSFFLNFLLLETSLFSTLEGLV